MVEEVPLIPFARSLGLYQLVLLSSRGIGFLRDSMVLITLGATSLSDDVFFLLGFTDLVTLIIAGGGASLYLSLNCKENFSSVYIPAMLFYLLIGLLFVVFEGGTGNAIGGFLYAPLVTAQATLSAYKILMFGFIFTFPLVVSYGYFLSVGKIHFQPIINMVYTVFSALCLMYFYIVGGFDIKLFASLILLAAFVRFFAAIIFVKWHIPVLSFDNFFENKPSFYFEMLTSGLAVGVLVSIPFVFRGYLPNFGEGVYSTSALVFKVNDMILALLIIPISSVVLTKYNLTVKLVVSLVGLAIIVSLGLVVLLYMSIEIFPAILVLMEDAGFSFEIIKYSVWSLLFTAVAYVLGVILVKLECQVFMLLISLSLLIFIRNPLLFDGEWGLGSYFSNFYYCYTVFILIAFLFMSYAMSKRNHVG